MSEYLSRISPGGSEIVPLVMMMENNLRSYIETAGLTQTKVADIFREKYGKSTIVYQRVGEWVRGVHPPELENALILSEIFTDKLKRTVTVNDLFSLE